jgi:hypothetical protein
VIAGTSLIVSVAWATSLLKEAREFPEDVAVKITAGTRDLKGVPVDVFKNQIADAVRAFINANYAPGGTLGYMRWALTSGEIRSGQLPGINRHYGRSQRGFWWAVRVVLAIVCLGFGIGSQTLPLRKAGVDGNPPPRSDVSEAS